MRRHSVFVAAAAFALAACTTGSGESAMNGPLPPPGDAAPAGLAGTSWQLVSFQSMDDAQGTTRPEPGRGVTLNFMEDGRLAAKLDCNRGTGTWSEGTALADGGGLTIGPMASTRVFCPEPSMGTMVARHLSDVASYTLRDGKLYLALKMDGGIFEFEPLD